MTPLNIKVKDWRTHDGFWALVLIAPCLLGLAVFTYVPMIASFLLSFAYWNLLGTPHWVGLDNYQAVLGDPLFWKTLGNTGVFVTGTALGEMTLGLLLAVAMNRAMAGRAVIRTLVFLPYITPMVTVALVWSWIYEPEAGLLNALLQGLHLIQAPVAWLYTPQTALAALMVLHVWKGAGYAMVIFLSGLQAIPGEVYESAALDGANANQVFWRLTLPMLSPTVFFVSTMAVINAFQAFDSVYLMTQGGPEHRTTLLVYWMFKHAFEFYKIGQASAIAYLLSAVILVLTLVQWRLRKRWVLHEE